MKKVLILIVALYNYMEFSSCTKNNKPNETQLVLSQAEKELKQTLNDTSSYQKVKYELVDSVTISQYTQEGIEIGMYSSGNSWRLAIIKRDSIKKDSCIKLISKLKQEPQKDSIIERIYKLTFRSTNGFGALIIGNIYITYHKNEKYFNKNHKFNLYIYSEEEYFEHKETIEYLKNFEKETIEQDGLTNSNPLSKLKSTSQVIKDALRK